MPTSATLRLDVPLDPAWRRAVSALGVFAGLALASWACAWLRAPWAVEALAALSFAGLGAAIGLGASRADTGCLSWDGEQWRWHDEGRSADEAGAVLVAVVADLGGWMLLRLDPGLEAASRARTRWVAVSMGAAVAGPVEWSAWRSRLLSSRARAPWLDRAGLAR